MRLFTSIFITLLLLSGCSSKPSLELVGATVEISGRLTEIETTFDERKDEIIQPISLSYHFVLKNSGKQTIGEAQKLNEQNFEYDDGIKVKIEPNEKLIAVSKEVMGFNIYDEEEMKQANLSIGKTSNPVLEPNQEGEYTLDFDLGALEENLELRVAPSSEQINKLKESALDATLIVSIEDKEIARYDLSNTK